MGGGPSNPCQIYVFFSTTKKRQKSDGGLISAHEYYQSVLLFLNNFKQVETTFLHENSMTTG